MQALREAKADLRPALLLQLFLAAYNHVRRLKTLRGLTPYEFICKTWSEQSSRFTSQPSHLTLGPNIRGVIGPPKRELL